MFIETSAKAGFNIKVTNKLLKTDLAYYLYVMFILSNLYGRIARYIYIYIVYMVFLLVRKTSIRHKRKSLLRVEIKWGFTKDHHNQRWKCIRG